VNENSDKKLAMQKIIDSYKDQLKQYYSQTHTSDVVDNDLIASEKSEDAPPVIINPQYNDFMVYDGENVYEKQWTDGDDEIDELNELNELNEPDEHGEVNTLSDEMYYDMEKFYSAESMALMEQINQIGQVNQVKPISQENHIKPEMQVITGKLKVMVFTARRTIPIENAEVEIFKLSQDEEKHIASFQTNTLGATDKFEVEVNDQENKGYIMKITSEGFVPTTYFNLKVSPFSAVIYSVDMVPLVASPNANREMQYFLN